MNNIVLTVDAGVFRFNKQNELEVLVIQRKKNPFIGSFAFCGGHVEKNEDPKDAVIRELKEETNLDGINPIVFDARGDLNRDPRGHYVSIFYHVELKDPSQEPQGGDDAAKALFVPLTKILGNDLENPPQNPPNKESFLPIAFDHYEAFKTFYQWLKINKKIKI
ncbi:adp-ribose pyrophosphatase [Anaeramoeba ignava]|uniref:Adp-ribose pyrophosphatase n=1 Tax=Anaeramoeba ignava TaxID=1746090 RepID=A0A9Q0LJV9_ANAIG|nr:adp-ribose pyrophosphatase [Anaeramoeba ignava]